MTVNMSGQDGSCQTLCSLIRHHVPRSGPSCIYRVSKILPVKADLAICSHAIGVSG